MTHFVIIAFRYNVTLFLVFYYFITVLILMFSVPFSLTLDIVYQLYTTASLLILFQALVIVLFVF